MRYGIVYHTPYKGKSCSVTTINHAIIDAVDNKELLEKLMEIVKDVKLCRVMIYDIDYDLNEFCDQADWDPEPCQKLLAEESENFDEPDDDEWEWYEEDEW